MLPDDRLKRAAQIVMLHLSTRTARLDERPENLPLRVRQHSYHVSIRRERIK
jgi:hypothetical protein